jgi:hypothetical protein
MEEIWARIVIWHPPPPDRRASSVCEEDGSRGASLPWRTGLQYQNRDLSLQLLNKVDIRSCHFTATKGAQTLRPSKGRGKEGPKPETVWATGGLPARWGENSRSSQLRTSHG